MITKEKQQESKEITVQQLIAHWQSLLVRCKHEAFEMALDKIQSLQSELEEVKGYLKVAIDYGKREHATRNEEIAQLEKENGLLKEATVPTMVNNENLRKQLQSYKELFTEIDAWLSFNTRPSKDELIKMRKSIQQLLKDAK